MNERNALPVFETPQQLSAYVQNKLMVILSRMAFDHPQQAQMLAAQLLSEMAAVGQQAQMRAETNDADRYDLKTLPDKALFDE